MILLRHAKRIAHDSGRGMALPGQYDGRFSLRAVRVRHDRKFADRHWGGQRDPKKRKPAVRAAGLLTKAIERE